MAVNRAATTFMEPMEATAALSAPVSLPRTPRTISVEAATMAATHCWDKHALLAAGIVVSSGRARSGSHAVDEQVVQEAPAVLQVGVHGVRAEEAARLPQVLVQAVSGRLRHARQRLVELKALLAQGGVDVRRALVQVHRRECEHG